MTRLLAIITQTRAQFIFPSFSKEVEDTSEILMQLGIHAESSWFVYNTYTLVSFSLSNFLSQSKLQTENQEGDRKGWRGNWNDRRQKKYKTSTECYYSIIGQWILVMNLSVLLKLIAGEIIRFTNDYNKGYKLQIFICAHYTSRRCLKWKEL